MMIRQIYECQWKDVNTAEENTIVLETHSENDCKELGRDGKSFAKDMRTDPPTPHPQENSCPIQYAITMRLLSRKSGNLVFVFISFSSPFPSSSSRGPKDLIYSPLPLITFIIIITQQSAEVD